MPEIPTAWGGSETAYDVPHRPTKEVRQGSVPSDGGGWLYDNSAGKNKTRTLIIDCTHTDFKGRVWADY